MGADLLYTFTCILAGHPLVPYPFHVAIGLYCPGCGVSRVCLSLLRLDFVFAFQANTTPFLLLPPGLSIAA